MEMIPEINSNEIKVTFRFIGDHIKPDIITSRLNIFPSEAHAKGDVVQKHPNRFYPTGYWGLNSLIPPEKPLEIHLAYLLNALKLQIIGIRECEKEGFCPQFFCGFFTSSENSTDAFIKIEFDTLKRVVNIGASLEIHLYYD